MRDMYVVIYAWGIIKVDLGVKPRDSEYDIVLLEIVLLEIGMRKDVWRVNVFVI